MKTGRCTGIAVALLLPLAGSAQAAGTYAGWIDSPGFDDTMVATTDDAGASVSSFAIAFRAECSGGRYFAFHRVVGVGTEMPPDGAVLVASRNEGGRFAATYTGTSDGGKLSFAEHGVLRGRFGPNRARGTLRITIDGRDAAGAVVTTCATRSLRWDLRRGAGRVYGGTTSQAEPVAMFLSPDRRLVRTFGFGWHTGCTSGAFIDLPDAVLDFRISRGRFGDAFDWVDEEGNLFQYTLRGQVGRSRASGTTRVTLFTTDGTQCPTGRLTWTARSG